MRRRGRGRVQCPGEDAGIGNDDNNSDRVAHLRIALRTEPPVGRTTVCREPPPCLDEE